MIFHVKPLLGRGFPWNIIPYFLQKVEVKKNIVSSAAILLGTLRVNFYDIKEYACNAARHL